MTRRTASPRGPLESCEELVEAGVIAFVEMLYPPKWLCRAGADLRYGPGYHAAANAAGPMLTGGPFTILHAPIRSREALEAKAEYGRRVIEADRGPGLDVTVRGRDSWHVRRFHRLKQGGSLAREWEANSFRDDALHIGGARHPVVFDSRLRDRVRSFVGGR